MVSGHNEVVSLHRLKSALMDQPILSSDCLLPSSAQSTDVTPSEYQKNANDFKQLLARVIMSDGLNT